MFLSHLPGHSATFIEDMGTCNDYNMKEGVIHPKPQLRRSFPSSVPMTFTSIALQQTTSLATWWTLL